MAINNINLVILLLLPLFFTAYSNKIQVNNPPENYEIYTGYTYQVTQKSQQLIFKHPKDRSDVVKITANLEQPKNFFQQNLDLKICIFSEQQDFFNCDIEGQQINYQNLYVEYTETNSLDNNVNTIIQEQAVYISIQANTDQEIQYDFQINEILLGDHSCPNECNGNPRICQKEEEICLCQNSINNSIFLDGRDCSIETVKIALGQVEKVQLLPNEQIFFRYLADDKNIDVTIDSEFKNQKMALDISSNFYQKSSNSLPILLQNSNFINESTILTLENPEHKNKNTQYNYLKLGIMNKSSKNSVTFVITINHEKSKILEIILICSAVFTFTLAIFVGIYIYRDYKKHKHLIQRVEKVKKEKEQKKKDINDFVPHYTYRDLQQQSKRQGQGNDDSPKGSAQNNNNNFKFDVEKVLAEDSCPICLIEFEEDEEVRVTICDHIFHKECLDDWYMKQQICPSCRQDITKDGIEAREQQNQTPQKNYKEKENKDKNQIPQNERLKGHKNAQSDINLLRKNSSSINSSQNLGQHLDRTPSRKSSTIKYKKKLFRQSSIKKPQYSYQQSAQQTEQTPVYTTTNNILFTDFTQSMHTNIENLSQMPQLQQQQLQQGQNLNRDDIIENLNTITCGDLPMIETQEDLEQEDRQRQRYLKTDVDQILDSPKDLPKLTSDATSQRPMLFLQSTDRNTNNIKNFDPKQFLSFTVNKKNKKNDIEDIKFNSQEFNGEQKL